MLTSASLVRIKSFYPSGDFDTRRFRPNIVVNTPRGASGFVEESWLGESISIGGKARLKVEKPNKRCKVTGARQGDLGEDQGIFHTIEKENANNLGVMCTVVAEGQVRVGDTVAMVA